MTPAAAPAISVGGISHNYAAKRHALQDVNLDVRPGVLCGLLGPNGSGKSTLFRILCTLMPPTQGRALILERDVVADAVTVRGSIGVVFQQTTLDPRMTVMENLIFHGCLQGLTTRVSAERGESLLEAMGLEERAEHRVGDLSGGLARRVDLARALLHHPQVLLLDEPTTALDPIARADFWAHLRQLAQNGMTILVSTHLMEEADLCDELAILHHGRIAARGTPDSLRADLGGEVLQVETADGAALCSAMESLAPDTRSIAYDDGVHITLPPGSLGAAARLLVSLAETLPPGTIRAAHIARPTLDDVFLKVTGTRYRDASAEAELN